jgi:hypothetical protein
VKKDGTTDRRKNKGEVKERREKRKLRKKGRKKEK